MTKENDKNKEFIKEYEELCLKHGVFIVTDYDGIESTHLRNLEKKEDEEFFKWSIDSLKR